MGHLAHELNSMLDGSLRSLNLARQSLEELAPGDVESLEAASQRLHRAHDGMRNMAKLLNRAMSAQEPELGLFDEQMPLSAQIEQIINAVRPLADEHAVTLSVDLTPRAAGLPSATLGPVILNGLRNAVQACIEGDAPLRCAELAIVLASADQLLILISDNGPGVHELPEGEETTKADGHGLGLDLCRQIVASLGGDLQLTTVPFGCGAVLQVRIPVRRLASHG